jgi:hypothetical protein
MRPYLRIALGLIIILLGIKAIKQAFSGYSLGLFHQLQYIPYGLLLIFTVAALLLDTSYFRIYKRPNQYVTSILGMTLCSIVIIKTIQTKLIDNSETIFQVSNLPGATNHLTFEFKTKSYFRLTEYDIFGQTVYYGKYVKHYDTLFISDNNYNGYIKYLPKTGKIIADTVYWNKFDTMLINHK